MNSIVCSLPKNLRMRFVFSEHEYHFLDCFLNENWGNGVNKFKNWQEGDYLIFVVDQKIAGFGVVDYNYFVGQTVHGTESAPYYLANFKRRYYYEKGKRIPLAGEIMDSFYENGNSFTTKLNLSLLDENTSTLIAEKISKTPGVCCYGDRFGDEAKETLEMYGNLEREKWELTEHSKKLKRKLKKDKK